MGYWSTVEEVTKPYLEPKEWYATLPTVYVSVCALLTDDRDRVLLVKPNYRPYWAIPGGILDPGEAPHECVDRELNEELGLKIQASRLLVVDFVPPQGDRPRPMMNFLFDGGTVEDPGLIQLEEDELDTFEFFSWEDAETKMPSNTAGRVPAARRARRQQQTIYLPAAH
jgi:8-oxo-dGTP pyrophosphatase MutT (NUDIX family)